MNDLWAPKFFRKEGLVKENVLGNYKALDVGCGNFKLPGAKGIDVIENSDADIVHNLDKYPWPFDDNEFDLVFMNNIAEHLQDLVKAMEEVYRISKNKARVIVKVPHFRHPDAYTDPTHIRFCTSFTMDFFIEGKYYYKRQYSSCKFRELGFWFDKPFKSKQFPYKLLLSFIYKHKFFYEKRISQVFFFKNITWELEVLK